MSGEVREQAWQAFCTRLETLGIDPYSPNLPPDDSRHAKLQAAVSEYEIAIGKVIPVPPGWEGHPPDRPIQSLVGLIEWLQGEWTVVLAYEIGGGQQQAHPLDLAARVVRNAFRVLEWLRVADRPRRPVPPETVADAKEQIDDLERWVRRKDKEGWTPHTKSLPQEAVGSSAVESKRRKRADLPDDYEGNILIKKYLEENPVATIKQVSEAISLSTGKIVKMDAWRREMAERKARKAPINKTPRSWTSKMEQAIGQKDDPAARIEADEAVWQFLLDKAKPAERAALHAKSPREKTTLIELAREQHGDRFTDIL